MPRNGSLQDLEKGNANATLLSGVSHRGRGMERTRAICFECFPTSRENLAQDSWKEGSGSVCKMTIDDAESARRTFR